MPGASGINDRQGRTVFEDMVRNVDLDKLIINGKLDVEEFIKFCYEMAVLSDVFGTLFRLAKSDFNMNIGKISRAAKRYDNKYRYVEDLIDQERADGNSENDDSAGIGFLWVQRTVKFNEMLFAEMDFSTELQSTDFKGVVRRAYDEVYSQVLPWTSRMVWENLITVAIGAVMDPAYLCEKFAYGKKGRSAELVEDHAACLAQLRPITRQMRQIVRDKHLEDIPLSPTSPTPQVRADLNPAGKV